VPLRGTFKDFSVSLKASTGYKLDKSAEPLNVIYSCRQVYLGCKTQKVEAARSAASTFWVLVCLNTSN
jgi:hypothetical protein